MSADEPTIVLSSGEPAGIGPDLCLMLARHAPGVRLAVLADPDMLADRAASLGLDVDLRVHAQIADVAPHEPGTLAVVAVPTRAPVVAGRIEPANAAYVLELLRRGAEACVGGDADALVTAPVHKSAITASGVPFSGHTEFLAELTGAAQPVMMLAGGPVRVALVTTHLPLRAVPDAITGERLERAVAVLHGDLVRRFRIAAPRIAVLGLNPHAGEQGTLGTEERDVIAPALNRLAAHGYRVHGPLPADTAFTPDALERCDAVLAMYHDQGLSAVKALAFGDVVNVTLGLPIIRTSVDHGTALTLAGTGRAKPDSLLAALHLALKLAAEAAAPA